VEHVVVLEPPRMGGKDQPKAQPMKNTSSFLKPPERAAKISLKQSR